MNQYNYACAAATILDSRFKKLAFTSSAAIEKVTRSIQGEMSDFASPQVTPNAGDNMDEQGFSRIVGVI